MTWIAFRLPSTSIVPVLIASAIHDNSLRAGKRFVKVSCAALPETLIESELFGYERGAFTGADARRQGRFELADGGTLFLDEIGDIKRNAMDAYERDLIQDALKTARGNRAKAARLLDTTGRILNYKIKTLGIDYLRFRI